MPSLTGRPEWPERVVRRLRTERWNPAGSWTVALFHNVTAPPRFPDDGDLTHGLGVDLPQRAFEDVLEVLANRYQVLTLDEALADEPPRSHQRPPLLLCFDDAYASVTEIAAPALERRGLPWTFFVNPGLIGNDTLGLDNLLAYAFNQHGPTAVRDATGVVASTVGQFISSHVAQLDPGSRARLGRQLAAALHIDVAAIANAAGLYIERHQLRELADSGVTIGNHTRDHVHCRALDEVGIREQVVASKRELESLVDAPIKAFAYPYGSHLDATAAMTRTLQATGHEAAFLVEGRINRRLTPPHGLYRISITKPVAQQLCTDLTVRPFLRELRARTRTLSRPGGH